MKIRCTLQKLQTSLFYTVKIYLIYVISPCGLLYAQTRILSLFFFSDNSVIFRQYVDCIEALSLESYVDPLVACGFSIGAGTINKLQNGLYVKFLHYIIFITIPPSIFYFCFNKHRVAGYYYYYL